jgi:3-deoxy-D-manno-octulosonate 8-phosphate phosphatase (KDO 8-P phosphatase)
LGEPVNNAADIRLIILDCDGTLTDGRIIYSEHDREIKNFSAKDGLGLHLAHVAGLRIAVITGRTSPMVTRRCADLHIEHVLQGVSNKRLAVDRLLQKIDLTWAQTAVVGDDWNDYPMMEPAALSACPSDAFPPFQQVVDVVLTRPGGDGAVREFIERLLQARNEYEQTVERFLDVLRAR